MVSSLRIPDVLRARIDKAAGGSGERSKWILEACRMRLDAGVTQGQSTVSEEEKSRLVRVQAPGTKPDMAALREICLGNSVTQVDVDGQTVEVSLVFIPPCIVCDSPMREIKGKWACVDASCGMYGKEQKPR